MKYRIALLFLLLLTAKGWSQPDGETLDSLKKVWTKELNAQLITLEIGTHAREGWSEFSDSVSNAFEKDTFLLNGLFSYQLDADQTTLGMVGALYDYEAGFDRLLNTYYQLLLKKLNKEDKELLKESQRNWIKLRDSERKLSAAITKEEYSGGGTIQQLFYADWNADFTKHRVEELIDYLTRF